ncbi:MAG: SCO1664 family protein [Acidimicrobiia bacterium]
MREDERPQALTPAGALLRTGEVTVRGRMPWSSNATFLVAVTCGEDEMLGIYKPGAGERPLWDFPRGLYRREVAAAVLSDALGWSVVPDTVVREGPLGVGSVQRYVDHDPDDHYFVLVEDARHHAGLRRLCALDIVANNTDRKAGHCLLDRDGRIWGIDNGLCFHPDPKLRTVIWDFAGEPLPDDVAADLTGLLRRLPAGLDPFLDEEELDAVADRTAALLEAGRFPSPHPDRRPYPWPLV